MRKPNISLDEKLTYLEAIDDRPALINLWREQYDCPPPRGISLKMMKLAIAYKLQEAVHGGLKPALRRHLNDVMDNRRKVVTPPPEMAAGTRLIRQWHGKVYEASFQADGVLVNGERYKSLSDAARAITGVRWSGPRFFGLVKVKTA